jgi:arylformamidase
VAGAAQQVYDALCALKAFDVSPITQTNMPKWPSHPDTAIIEDSRTIELHKHFIQTLILPEHSGSHVDAPAHFHSELRTIEQFPAEYLIRPYKKYDLRPLDPQPGDTLTGEHMREAADRDGITLNPGDIAILQYGWDRHYHPDAPDMATRLWYAMNSPGLDESACAYFVDAGVTAVAADNAACESAVIDGEVIADYGHHIYFLPNEILIIEGLQGLDRVPAEGLFVALPMKIKGGSGSPIRIVLYG